MDVVCLNQAEIELVWEHLCKLNDKTDHAAGVFIASVKTTQNNPSYENVLTMIKMRICALQQEVIAMQQALKGHQNDMIFVCRTMKRLLDVDLYTAGFKTRFRLESDAHLASTKLAYVAIHRQITRSTN